MAIPVIDLSNVIKWFSGSGTGTAADPYVLTVAGGTGGDASAANQVTTNTEIGATNESAAATDTSTSGLNGLLKRIAQRLTSLIALFPTALGSTTAAASFPVTLSSDGPFSTLTGAVTETAPATDTASSGTNGRLQRIAQRLTSLIALVPAALGQGTMAQSLRVVLASDQSTLPVTPAAGELHLGEVGVNQTLTAFTLVADTNIYASGDVLSDTALITNVFRVTGGKGILTSLVLNDEDDQGIALDVVFLDANVSLGTFNVAPAITDANARNILGIVSVLATDWIDLGGVRVATVPLGRLGIQLSAVTASKSLGIATITRGGTPTYTASGITGRIGVECS